MILDMFSLQDKVALVTGASRGLGQGIALGLAEAGADIAGVSRGSTAETKVQVTALGRRYLALKCDLSQASVAELYDLVEQTVSALGHIDILVNAAGINHRTASLEFAEEDWDRVLQVNLKSAMYLSQAAARRFAEQGKGKIISVASAMSFQGGYIIPAYTAAKHGILGMTKALGNEFASLGINVNAIAPGYMDTDMTAALIADPNRGPAISQRIPAGRWGTPQDLQGAAVFLASAASDYCHGSVVVVDGGWLNR
ncbi:MAG: 2-dehydro-3-deoxy-D-gluconate 5-dehydrogenase KduD [Chloroflexi bacterium]|mgnify:CR=1 FL=1|nr:2-dehydro-3-deoxy-D-gluconate 5-dehydrogenase KduD [Chloroflexota bacterium]